MNTVSKELLTCLFLLIIQNLKIRKQLLEKLDFEKTLSFDEFPAISSGEWESVIKDDLKGKDYKEVLRWKSGEEVDPLPFYRRENLSDLQHEVSPIQDSGTWNIIESVEGSSVKSANEEALSALESGASGLCISPPKNYIQSKSDLESLLDGIQIELIILRFGNTVSSPEIAKWLKEICREKGLNEEELTVSFNFDPLSHAVLNGKLPSKPKIEEAIHLFNSSFHSCAIDSSVFANTGATIIQQIAFSLAAGNEYLGLDSKFSENIHFNFASGPNYFLEIAKFRAFKLVWAQVLAEYGLKENHPYIFAETSFWNKSQTDAHNNMLRATTEAMSAAIGGCDAITVHRFDKHFAEDSSFASRIARNIQIILQEEAYLDKVTDPSAGSYYIEVLTNGIAQKSWTLFQEIESKGGFYECLKSGFIQELISSAKQDKIDAYKQKQKVLVGVNKYQPDEKIQDLEFKIQNFTNFSPDMKESITIDSISLLNIEAELQIGES